MKKRILSILFVCFIGCFALSGCKNVVNVGKYKNAKDYSIGNFTYNAENIKKVEINWVAGEININQSDNKTLSVKENGEQLDDSQKLHYLIDGTTLIIQYAKSNYRGRIDENLKKLNIEVPKNVSLDIDTVSADVVSDSLYLNDLDIDSVSASINISLLDCGEANIDTVSGNAKINSLKCPNVDFDSTSANLDIDDLQCEKISFDSTSGNLNICLPGKGLTVDIDSVSGKLISSKEYTKSNGKYIFGDGTTKIDIDTVSGDIIIK